MRLTLVAGCTRTAEIDGISAAEVDTTVMASTPNADLDLELTVIDPDFDRSDNPAMDAYVAGEAKEGVGTGGALALAARSDVSMAAVSDRIVDAYEGITDQEPAVKP